jgi:hypothetical protein
MFMQERVERGLEAQQRCKGDVHHEDQEMWGERLSGTEIGWGGWGGREIESNRSVLMCFCRVKSQGKVQPRKATAAERHHSMLDYLD